MLQAQRRTSTERTAVPQARTEGTACLCDEVTSRHDMPICNLRTTLRHHMPICISVHLTTKQSNTPTTSPPHWTKTGNASWTPQRQTLFQVTKPASDRRMALSEMHFAQSLFVLDSIPSKAGKRATIFYMWDATITATRAAKCRANDNFANLIT